MTEVFADSFYWIALLNPADAFHDTADGGDPQDAIDLFPSARRQDVVVHRLHVPSRSCGGERLPWRCPRTIISGRQASRRRLLYDVAA